MDTPCEARPCVPAVVRQGAGAPRGPPASPRTEQRGVTGPRTLCGLQCPQACSPGRAVPPEASQHGGPGVDRTPSPPLGTDGPAHGPIAPAGSPAPRVPKTSQGIPGPLPETNGIPTWARLGHVCPWWVQVAEAELNESINCLQLSAHAYACKLRLLNNAISKAQHL